MKKVFLFLILSLLSILAYAQDYIVLKSGEQIIAIVIDESSTEVRYKLHERPNGRTRIVPRADVAFINYDKGTWDDPVRETSRLKPTSEANEKQLKTSDIEEFKRCPYCGEEILAVAIKCKHCGEWLDKPATSRTSKKQSTAKNSQGVTIEKPFKGVALGINVLTGYIFKNSYMDVGFGANLSYTFSIPFRLAGEFDILWGIPTYEAWFLSTRWMDYGVSLQYLISGKGKRFAAYPLVGLGGINFNVKERVTESEFGLSLNRFMFTLGYGFEGLSKNCKFFYGFEMRFKIAKLDIASYKAGYRIHTVVRIGYKF